MTPILPTSAKKLAHFRIANGHTFVDVEFCTGISRCTINGWEHGVVPSMKYLIKAVPYYGEWILKLEWPKSQFMMRNNNWKLMCQKIRLHTKMVLVSMRKLPDGTQSVPYQNMYDFVDFVWRTVGK
jgi:transcriptional regulator with XRE-family HTH domain